MLFQKVKNNLLNMSEKSSIILKNVVGAFVIRGLSLCISVFSMPAYIRFFNNQTALGTWFTLLSVLNWILNFDLGIGNGLRNKLTKSLAENRDEDSKGYISSAYFSIGILVLVSSVVFYGLFGFVDWNLVFNIDTTVVSASTMLLTIKIVFGGIMLQFLLKLINSILYAMQKSSVNNFLALCTSVLTIISLFVLPSGTNEQNMIVMAIVHALAVLLPLLIATIIVFTQEEMRDFIPSFKFFTGRYAKQVLALGGTFFFVQVAYMVIVNTDSYLIALLSTPEAVVDYQVYHRLFTLGGTVFSLALTPVWSAVTKAIAEQDYGWIQKLYKRLTRLAFIATLCEFLLVPFLQPIVNLWLGSEAIETHVFYAMFFAMVGSLMIWNGTLSSIANGIGELKTQCVLFSIGAILKIALSWFFVMAFNTWIGVVIADVVAIGAYCLVQSIVLKHILFNRTKSKEE